MRDAIYYRRLFLYNKDFDAALITLSSRRVIWRLDPKKRSKRVPISLRFEDQLIDEISAYCKWLGVARLQDFFEQAAEYILKNDRDWREAKDPSKTMTSKKMTKN